MILYLQAMILYLLYVEEPVRMYFFWKKKIYLQEILHDLLKPEVEKKFIYMFTDTVFLLY